MGFVKLNVDAIFYHDQLRGTMGVVIRDDSGNFIVGGNFKIERCMDALTAETLALRFGLLLAQRRVAIVSLSILTTRKSLTQ